MASEKPTKILRSKTDMTLEKIEKLTDAQAWGLIYSSPSTKRIKNNHQQICFTGFGKSKKEELIRIANKNNFNVVSSVTQNLNYLVIGDNSGPKKIEKAKFQGATILNESDFINLINKSL